MAITNNSRTRIGEEFEATYVADAGAVNQQVVIRVDRSRPQGERTIIQSGTISDPRRPQIGDALDYPNNFDVPSRLDAADRTTFLNGVRDAIGTATSTTPVSLSPVGGTATVVNDSFNITYTDHEGTNTDFNIFFDTVRNLVRLENTSGQTIFGPCQYNIPPVSNLTAEDRDAAIAAFDGVCYFVTGIRPQ